MHLLGIIAIVYVLIQIIKEHFEKPIPAENWANKDLYYKDMMSGVPSKQLMKNVKNGKYKLDEKYPEPHRDPKNGKIIIENDTLWKEDLGRYDPLQVDKWVKQGKYNLTPEELEKKHEEYRKKMDELYNLLDK